MIVLHAKLDTAFSAPGGLRCVGHVEDVGHATHESHGARARVKVADLAFEILHFGLPGLDGWWFQSLLELFGSEAITNGRAGRLLRGCGGRRGGREESLDGAILVRARHVGASVVNFVITVYVDEALMSSMEGLNIWQYCLAVAPA